MRPCAVASSLAALSLLVAPLFPACGGGTPSPEGPSSGAEGAQSGPAEMPKEEASPTPTGGVTEREIGTSADGKSVTKETELVKEPAPGPTASNAEVEEGKKRTLDDIRAVIDKHRATVRACYDEAAKKDPKIEGQVLVHFVLNPDGTVRSAEVKEDKSDIKGNKPLFECMLLAIKKMPFPETEQEKGETTVNYPFRFKSAGGGKK